MKPEHLRVVTVVHASALAPLLLVLVLLGFSAELEASPAIRESKFELFTTDVDEAVRFYSVLGFEVAHRKPDGYTTLASGGVVVALSPVPSWLPLSWLGFLRYPPLGTEIVLYTQRLRDLRTALERAGFEPGPIELQPWGDRDFRVTDGDGYYVRVSEGSAVPAVQ